MPETRAARDVRRSHGGLAVCVQPACVLALVFMLALAAALEPVPIGSSGPTGLIEAAHAAGSAAWTGRPAAGQSARNAIVTAAPAAAEAARSPAGAAMPIPGFHGPFESSPTTASGPVRAEPAHMPFYVATQGATTIYLLGTLHVGDPADYPPDRPFRRRILAALAASSTLALELSPDDLIESQDDVTKYGVCSDACLPRLLPPSLWRKLASRLHENPAALEGIKTTRPWLAALLVETYASLSAGLQTEYGTEAQLQDVYLRKHGKVVGLETLAEQMRAFTNLTLAQQREMLAQDLAQTPAQTVADVKELHRLWRAGNADAIAAWSTAKSERLAQSRAVARSLDNKILYERNRRFTTRMLGIAAPNRPVFVAIGALHLGGPKGVLALLRQRGYVVEAN
jgi:uncharacterized protein